MLASWARDKTIVKNIQLIAIYKAIQEAIDSDKIIWSIIPKEILTQDTTLELILNGYTLTYSEKNLYTEISWKESK